MFRHGSDAEGENPDGKVPKLSSGNWEEVVKLGQLCFRL